MFVVSIGVIFLLIGESFCNKILCSLILHTGMALSIAGIVGLVIEFTEIKHFLKIDLLIFY
jgi:hypothetical protein